MRLEGWDKRLYAVIEDARSKPYVLGEHDCLRLACRVIEALTGKDRWPEVGGTYRTKAQALAMLARRGRSFEEVFDTLGPRVRPAQARRGDIGCVQTEDGMKHLGICLGSETAVLADTGLLFVPTSSCLCAWRID